MDVGVVGGSGYGGAELLRLLASHPSLKVRAVGASRAAGRPVGAVFPHLEGLEVAGVTMVESEPDMFAGLDLVFLATPVEVSLALAGELLAGGSRVVDLSAAFRLDAHTFEATYGLAHLLPERTPAPYALCELFRSELPQAELAAVLGCYVTASLLALAPLVDSVDPASVVVTGMSGASGAGKSLRDDLHVSHAIGNVAAYAAPRHRHLAELAGIWAAWNDGVGRITFTPHLVPMARGLMATVVADLDGPPDDLGERGGGLHAHYAQRYAPEPFVTVLDEGSWPATTHVVGGNAAHIGMAVDERAGRVVAACAIDNLVKGASGQAVQAANLMLGLPEGEGLTPAGTYP